MPKTELPITDERMTRFWISLQQGVEFVLDDFQRMHGGEIFVPKIPSVRVTDLARAIAPDLPTRVIGIRPGEKLHEVLIQPDASWQTVEYDRHYVIKPSFNFNRIETDYLTAANGETGRLVGDEFDYNSRDNDHYVDAAELREMIAGAMPFDA